MFLHLFSAGKEASPRHKPGWPRRQSKVCQTGWSLWGHKHFYWRLKKFRICDGEYLHLLSPLKRCWVMRWRGSSMTWASTPTVAAQARSSTTGPGRPASTPKSSSGASLESLQTLASSTAFLMTGRRFDTTSTRFLLSISAVPTSFKLGLFAPVCSFWWSSRFQRQWWVQIKTWALTSRTPAWDVTEVAASRAPGCLCATTVTARAWWVSCPFCCRKSLRP